MRGFVVVCLVLVACGTPAPVVRSSAPSAGGPAWANEPDRTERGGNVFTCEGAGATEEEAFSAAKQLCSDKLCKLCGVKIESRVEVKETLKGVQMQRKVVERCTRARTRDMEIRYKQNSCGPEGCRSWVQSFYSSADQDKECKRFSDDNFADPAQCQKILEDFARVPGLTSAAFQRRYDLLLGAEAACAEIDVRPTPLMESLDEHLWIGISQIARETFDGKVFGRCRLSNGPTTKCGGKDLAPREFLVAERADKLERVRTDLANEYYTFPERQSLKTTPNFVARLQIASAWAAEHVKTYAAIDALTDPAAYSVMGDTYYTREGLARLVAALRGAPKTALGNRNRPVHFWVMVFLFLSENMPGYGRHRSFDAGQARDDNQALSQAVREVLSPAEAVALGIPDDVSRVFVADDKLDDAEWKHTMAMQRVTAPRYWGCPECVAFALRARDQGGFATHKARLLEAIKDERIRTLLPGESDVSVQIFPNDGALIQAVWPELPEAFRNRFESVANLYEEKYMWLTPAQRTWLLDQLEATLDVSVYQNEKACEKLPDRLAKLAAYGRTPSAHATICGCFKVLTNPTRRSPFRQSWIEDFYRQQAGRGLDCLVQGSRR